MKLEHITYNIVRWEHYSFYILHLDLNTLIPMCCCFHYCHIVMSTSSDPQTFQSYFKPVTLHCRRRCNYKC